MSKLNSPLKVSENDVKKAVIDYLTLKGYVHFRNNSGVASAEYKGRSRFFRYGMVGSGDIIGLTKEGRFFSIELKAPGKRPSENQTAFMQKVCTSHGLAFTAWSVDDVVRAGL